MNDSEIVDYYLARNEEAINQTALKYGTRFRNLAFRIVEDLETAKECENAPIWRPGNPSRLTSRGNEITSISSGKDSFLNVTDRTGNTRIWTWRDFGLKLVR